MPLLEEHEPDVFILDLGLPRLNGLNVLRKIQDRGVSVQIMILSMHEEDAYVSEAFDLGVSSYVLKGAPTDDVIAAVRAAVAGERYLGSGLSEDILDANGAVEDDTGDRYDRLTDREREVLQLTAEGYTSREIGERLYISHRTVDKHREHIQSKLGLSGTVEMTAYAHRRGIIPAPPTLEDDDRARNDDPE